MSLCYPILNYIFAGVKFCMLPLCNSILNCVAARWLIKSAYLGQVSAEKGFSSSVELLLENMLKE